MLSPCTPTVSSALKCCCRKRRRCGCDRNQSPDAHASALVLDFVCADRARARVVAHDVLVHDVAVELVVRADTKPNLLACAKLTLAPVEEVRGLVLDVASARAPREERAQVWDDGARVAIPVPVDR